MIFWAPGLPKGQPRGRATVSGGKPRVWTPGTAEAWKAAIANAAKPVLPREPIAYPVRLEIEVFFKRPQRLCRKKDPGHPLPHSGLPDWDNAAKAIGDALVDIGMLDDDKWVTGGTVNKWYTCKGGRTGALIRVKRVDETALWGGPNNPSVPWAPGGEFTWQDHARKVLDK